MKMLILFQLLMIPLNSYALEKSVSIRQIKGMDFEYIVSKQGVVVLDPTYCDKCAQILVKGEPYTEYKISCDFVDAVREDSRIIIEECLMAHNRIRVSESISTDSRGNAHIVVGSRINVRDEFPSGKYQGKIIVNIAKIEKEGAK